MFFGNEGIRFPPKDRGGVKPARCKSQTYLRNPKGPSSSCPDTGLCGLGSSADGKHSGFAEDSSRITPMSPVFPRSPAPLGRGVSRRSRPQRCSPPRRRFRRMAKIERKAPGGSPPCRRFRRNNPGPPSSNWVPRRVGGLEDKQLKEFRGMLVPRRVGGLEGVRLFHSDSVTVPRRVGGLEVPPGSWPRPRNVPRRVGGLEAVRPVGLTLG